MTNATIKGLPNAFTERREDGFEFRMQVTPDEYWIFVEALYPFVCGDVSIFIEYASGAYRSGDPFGKIKVRVTNDEFRAREVAEALRDLRSEILEIPTEDRLSI